MGFQFCPGCGLGHSISYLFHGQVQDSLNAHPLGILALPVISFRIFKLVLYNNPFNLKISNNGIRI